MSETEPERPSPAPEAPSDLATAPIRAAGTPTRPFPVAARRDPAREPSPRSEPWDLITDGVVELRKRRPADDGCGAAGTADGRGQSSGSAATNGS